MCPNLDSAHILYNVLKMTGSHGVTVGPILLGAASSAHVLTPSATVRRVVNMTALAVANGLADVATNNTTDLERFGRQFPAEAERLQVIWRSQSTPAAEILVRSDMPPALRRKLRDALTAYGR